VVWTTDSDSLSVQKCASYLEEAAVSDSNYDRKRELECLRLAADLIQLAADTLNPHLKAHCLRVAKVWSGEAEKTPVKYVRHTGAQSTLYH
jgi:hypothetical protein